MWKDRGISSFIKRKPCNSDVDSGHESKDEWSTSEVGTDGVARARCQKVVVGKRTHKVTIRCGKNHCFWRRWNRNPVF
ncbi:hypothetical protein SUGI_1086870 [Cryptomeria japonica]|nr:hypothetical protein SUGI_1086870 [Cryptomeria japonica]